MYSRYEHDGLVWIDLESPTRDEVTRISNEFRIETLIAEELLFPATKPRAEFYDEYAYLVMHFPALRHSHKTREQEIDFIVGKDFLITTHYDTIDPLHKFAKIFEVHTILDKGEADGHAGFLFFYMLKKLYKAVEHEVEYVRHEMAEIEEHIFLDEQVEMVVAISRSARDLLNLRQMIEPHRDVLQTLEADGPRLFGTDFTPYLRALSNEYYRVHNHVMRELESLRELRETNNSLLTTKQNETMKVFTILAFMTFPLALITSIFSMDAPDTPIVSSPHGFWIVMGILAIVAIIMMWYFRSKKWF
ncbi:MAG TPA: magnesium transporter CorA family protein [Candidatus Paceibacterota bacterium]|nr:magnesium transporter CorA family protein [Candidatus Paceibacterota bacterium]